MRTLRSSHRPRRERIRKSSNDALGHRVYAREGGYSPGAPRNGKPRRKVSSCDRADKLTQSRINAEFRKLRAEQPEGVLKLDGAELGAYSYPKKYKYPQAVLDAEAEWKRLKAVAEADGTATQVKRTEDPDKDTLFTVKLLQEVKP